MGLIVTTGARYWVDTVDVSEALDLVSKVAAGTATAEEASKVTDLAQVGAEVTGESESPA